MFNHCLSRILWPSIGLALLLSPFAARGDDPGTWVTDANGCRMLDPATKLPADVRFRWTGRCVNGLAQGPGQLETSWDNGAKWNRFQGTFQNGRRQGTWAQDAHEGNRHVMNYRDGVSQGLRRMSHPNGTGSVHEMRDGKSQARWVVAFKYPDGGWCAGTCTTRGTSSEYVFVHQERGSKANEIPCGADIAGCRQKMNVAVRETEQRVVREQQREAEFRRLLQSGAPQQLFLAADRYENQGDASKALQLYQALIERFPNHNFAAEAATRLRIAREKAAAQDQQRREQEARQAQEAQAERERRAADNRMAQERRAVYEQCQAEHRSCMSRCKSETLAGTIVGFKGAKRGVDTSQGLRQAQDTCNTCETISRRCESLNQ